MTWTEPAAMDRRDSRNARGAQGSRGGGAMQQVDPYPVGKSVRVEIGPGNERVGEVVCWDPAAQVIIIKRAIPGETSRYQTHIVNMRHAVQVVALDAPAAPLPASAPPDFPKLRKKLERELAKRERSFTLVEVSARGQALFFAVQRTLEDVRWAEATLVVMGSVEIHPPYGPDDVRPRTAAAKTAAEHVRKIVVRELARLESRAASESAVAGADPAILSASLSAAPPRPTLSPPTEGGAPLPRSSSDDGAAFVDAPEELSPLPSAAEPIPA